MFEVLFWYQLNNLSHSLENKIQVVIFMPKYESLVMVIHQLQRRGRTTNILERYPVISIYQKFKDRARTRRPSTSKSLVHIVFEDETIN